jgi:F-type H+-transporting ATPase subunit b
VLLASSSGSTTNFIVPNGTFVVELVIFLVVLGVNAKFILPALRKVLDERGKTLADAQRVSDAARVEAARLDEERATLLANARAEARTIFDQASRSVDDLIEEARARGQAEFDRRLATAAGAIEDERRRVYDSVMQGAVDLVVAAAERIVGDGVDAERHRDAIAAELAGADGPVTGE